MELFEKIRYQVPILNLASRLGLELDEESCDCPFCAAPRPALTLDAGSNQFHCQSCGRRGGQVDLVRQVRRLGREQALDWLAEQYALSDDGGLDRLLGDWRRDRSRAPSLDQLFGGGDTRPAGSADPSQLYEALIGRCPLVEPAIGFLERRSWPQALVSELEVGWVGSPGELFEQLEQQFGRDALRGAGLLDGQGRFLFNHHRLLVPFRVDKRVVFLRARRLDAGGREWLSPRGRRPPLFPHDRLKRLEQGSTVYLVPDLPELVALRSRGVEAVAVLWPDDRPDSFFAPLTRLDPVLCGEPDDAGRAFNSTLIRALGRLGCDARIGEVPPGYDDWNSFRLFTRV